MLEIIPLKYGVKSEGPTQLEAIVRVVPEVPSSLPPRPALNLGLVLDRSGSMAGAKLKNTIEASQRLVRAMNETDRLSVVLFDDKVSILVPSTPVTDKNALCRVLQSIASGGSTDLHSGWLEGSMQVAQHLHPEHLNRVLLLTDGQANVGETNLDTIATHVNGLAQRGVSTSTLGFGSDYNETLLRSMAASGDGNHYFVESPEQLNSIFELELGGLVSTVGQKVRLTLECPGRLEVLTRLETEENGSLRLNDLVLGNPLTVLVRMHLEDCERQPVLCARLDYFDLAQKQPAHSLGQMTLPVVSEADWGKLHQMPEVLQELALREAARAREQARVELDRGDQAAATRILTVTLDSLRGLPQTPLIQLHSGELAQLLDDVAQRKLVEARKRSVQQEYSYYRGSVTLSGLKQVKDAIEAAKRQAEERKRAQGD